MASFCREPMDGAGAVRRATGVDAGAERASARGDWISACGSALYRRFRAAADRAGLPAISFHDLRHTFGTEMVERVDIHTLQRLMGHSHITTTQKYLHYRPDPGLSALMDEVWSAGESGQVRPLRVA